MVAYLVGMAHAFVPLAVIAGLMVALRAVPPSRRVLLGGLWCVVLGMAAGWAAHVRAEPRGSIVATATLLDGWAIACALVAVAVVAARRVLPGGALRVVGVPGALVILASIAAQAMFRFLERVANQSFTATSVLNTELVLNAAAVLTGIAVIGVLVVLTAHAGRIVGKAGGKAGGRAAAALLVAVLLLQSAEWAVGGMLGLLQMRFLDVTGWRVAFIAKATDLLPLAIYLHLLLIAVLAALAHARRPRIDPTEADPKGTDRPDAGRPGIGRPDAGRPVRRKTLAAALAERRWLRGTAAAVAFLAAVLLYHDLYASLPPALSPAIEKTPDAAGTIRIPIDAVKDGKLHRFAYIAEDGHRVRFFLINRYDADHVKIGVVFDACTICGDTGYIQDGHEVMCSSCNVRIFIPSIGKAGGCNPIPLPHEEEAGTIVITAAALEDGARYFSEVVARTVKDPVNGAAVVSRTAPFKYEHNGKTYYFAGRESYESFRADPDAYVAGK